jgi:hypothetical protein
MPDPSMEGMREAIAFALRSCICPKPGLIGSVCCPTHGGTEPKVEAALRALADYLRTHGVLLGGEGLVRVQSGTGKSSAMPGTLIDWTRLVPVPSEAES